MNDICASIQFTIVNILMKKLKLASKITGITEVAIAGGVSANSEIRETLKSFEKTMGWTTYIPKFEYTTDNAGMIGIVGYYKYLNHDFEKENALATSRLDINS
jgi:N6-L-threonylcarbamoyladenine synthase